MNRQYQDSSSMCYCGRNEHINRHKYSCDHQGDSSSEDENEYLDYSLPKHDNSYKNSRPHSNCHSYDDQSWKTLSTLRKKSCRCSRSEMDEATAADPLCSQGTYPNENQYGKASLLRRANDLIDYAPESEFLKKIKQQCWYLQNSQPNIFYTINDFIENGFSSYECQKCEVKSNPVLRHRGQLNNDNIKSVSEKSWKCCCNQQSDVTSANDDQVLNKNLANLYRMCKEFMTEKQPNEKKQAKEKSKIIKKKSEHVSRSKKLGQCSSRRKRKSGSIEKCESKDQFEPTLKKPHENSCERCWRFASPSRSPVNKPDQKYNPNFRKGHSLMDLEKGDGDIVDKESQCENFEPIICKGKERSPSPFYSAQQKHHVARSPSVSFTKDHGSVLQPSVCTSTRVKELLNEKSFRKPLENYLPSARTTDNCQIHKTEMPDCHKILLSDSLRKPRPKSYTPGLSSPKVDKCPNGTIDLDLTDYKTICMNPKKYCCDTSSSSKSPKTPSTVPSTFKESCVTSSRGGSPGRSFDHSSLKPIPEAVTEAPKESKSNTSKVNFPKTPKNLEERETPKTQSGTKNLRASTPKKPATEATKSASVKSKGNQKPASSKAKNVHLETKPPKQSPQITKPQASSDKCKCSENVLENFCADKEKSQSTTNSDAKEYHYNPKPSCGNTAEHHRSSHPIRDCSCYPRIPKSKNDSNDQNGHIFCCHCDWGENQKNQTNKPSFKSSVGIPIHDENVRLYGEPNTESNERRFMMNPESRPCNYRHTHKTSSPESSFVQSPGADADFSGRTLACPYRDYMNKTMPLKSSNSPENGECSTWEKEYQSSKERQKTCEDKERFLKGSPRKYFVFYMTKSKEPKEHKRGDDVEVLVEEFGQTYTDAKDARTKDIASKMKKIFECPSDSMALRFQKGVTETCKTPPSSRILYF